MVACSSASTGTSQARKDGGPTSDGQPATIAPLPLGMPEVIRFAYRKRAGHPAFKQAREAEGQGDWPAVAVACEAALAADPDHLDAAYLLAVARAKTGQLELILPPLAKAVAGDFGKWGQASLDQPALQRFLATPSGQAWRARIETDRATYIAAIARSLVVTAGGDLFAFDPDTSRWFRLTRTAGAVIGSYAVRAVQKLAYVTRQRTSVNGKHQTTVGVGLVDLATGVTRRQVEVPTAKQLQLGYSEKKAPGFIVRTKTAWQLVDDGKLQLVSLPPMSHPESVPSRLDVTGRTAKLRRVRVDNVSADWDKRLLASAIRIGSSSRVVTVPSPGLIDGNTAQWSPDRSQLAFVAQLAEECTPNMPRAAVFVADAATGKVTELERAIGGIAIDWLADRRLAIAGDRGVSIVELGDTPPLVLAGADGLAMPKQQPPCTAEPDEPIDQTGDDDPGVE